MLYDIGKEDTSLSSSSLRFPKLQTLVEMFCANSLRPVWSRHINTY